MKPCVVGGILLGGVIGAVSVMIAMPYIRPKVNEALQKGKQAIGNQIDKLMD